MDSKGVLATGALTGKEVISVESGNRLGQVRDVFIDPINGVVLGLTVSSAGEPLGVPYDEIVSVGHDAVMVSLDSAARPAEVLDFAGSPRAADLIGTRVITVSGNVLGHIGNVFLTLSPPPIVLYSLHDSIWDKVLNRETYILASAGHALSDDNERLIVPDEAAEESERSLDALLNKPIQVRSYQHEEHTDTATDLTGYETHVVFRQDDDETVLRSSDDDTVIRLRPDLNPEVPS